MKEKIRKYAPQAAVGLFLAALCGLILFSEGPMLWLAQEQSLWLPTEPFRESMMRLPGGLLLWASCFLTQLFYHPWMGVGALLLLWASTAVCTQRLFGLKGWNRLLSLLPAVALAGAITQNGYWIYYMKMPGLLFVPSLGTAIATALALGVKSLPGNRWLRTAAVALTALIAYPFAGAWSFMAAGLACSSLTELAGAAAAIIVGPLVYYRTMYGETMLQYMWSAALPSYRYGQETYFWPYHVPYYGLALSFLLALTLPLLTEKIKRRRIAALLPALLLAGYAVGLYCVWYRDTNFDKEIRMQRAVEERDWESVLRTYKEKPQAWGHKEMPVTRIMVMMKNVALLRVGRAGDEMFTYQDGAELQHAPFPVKMTQVGGKMIYYEVGKENFCTRWNMEDAVEFGWRVSHLKYMAKAALVSRDWEVARKYLRLLKKTMWQGEWAERYMPFVGEVKKCWDDEELGFIMRLLPGADRLDGDKTLVEMYLLQTFSHGMGADKNYAELTLMCALIMQDIDLFWPRFFRYAQMLDGERMPTHYQEAAYLYGQLEPGKVDISGMPFDESVKRSYYDFCQFNQQLGPNMSEAEKAVRFRPAFGNTFYYFYFLVRNVKTN